MMAKEINKSEKIVPGSDWEFARPEKLPEPTYWPFFLVMGLAFIFWGLLTMWVILCTGILIFITALIGWVNLMRRD